MMIWHHRWSAHLLAALALALSGPIAAPAQTFDDFDDFLRRYARADPGARPALARSFIESQQSRSGFPIRDPNGEVIFVHLADGVESGVRLTGDFSQRSFTDVYWDDGEAMTRMGDLFYLRKTFEPDARLDYRFIVDGRPTVDPLNPRTLFSGAGNGEASELVMPAHRSPPELVRRTGVPEGKLLVVDEPWADPRVTVYLPHDYPAAGDYPTLYTADGGAWIRYIGLPMILDNLIADGSIEPVIAVLIDPAADRSAWYAPGSGYVAYLKRIVEYIDGRYASRARADARLHAGTSAGGRATAVAAFELPATFGMAAIMSASFADRSGYFEPYLAGLRMPSTALRVWMSAGTYEGALYRDTQRMADALTRAGISTRAVSLHQGHSFGAWREAAVEVLRHFFPKR
jgi:enterochelin esterase-like enzyme